jgi:Spy/CpxP family protein refolding chaperone
MKKSLTNKTLMVLTVVVIVGFGAYAFAGWGMEYGHHGWGRHGSDWHHEGWGGPGYGNMMGDMSDEDIKNLNKTHSDFFKSTKYLRQDLNAKELELRSEFAKQNPDANKAIKLQEEISNLKTKLDQEHLEHMIQIRKINPDAGRGFMGRGAMGYGPSYGSYCWR